MKKFIKKYLPFGLYIGVLIAHYKAYIKFVKYSSVVKEDGDTKLLSKIIADYHVVEKGLTMSETRLGFGKERVLQLIKYCETYVSKYNNKDIQLIHAINVITEYRVFHEKLDFTLDKDLLDSIYKVEALLTRATPSQQKYFTRNQYYKNIDEPFELFSKSRLSVRNYSDKVIPVEELKKAVDLAKHCPSSCNRQTIRTNVYSDKKLIKQVLEIQGGNRGFGHLADKLIILTSDLSYWHGVYERTGPYVDGGIFAMNLLLSLHSFKIATCPLNCNLSPAKEKILRKLCNIPSNEVFVVMMSCGYTPEEFKVPYSKRYDVDSLIRIH